MKQGRVAAAFVVALGLTVACGPPEGNASGGGNTLRALPVPVSVTGCLTAAGDRALLTALAPGQASEQLGRRNGARPYPITEVYELTGANEKWRKYIGWQVQVYGEAPPPAVAIVQERSPAVPASPVAVGTAGESPSQGEGSVQVRTQQQIRFEVTQLRVMSVTPIRDVCADGAS